MPGRALILALLASALLSPPALAAEGGKKDKSSFVAIDTLTAMVMAANGRKQVMTVQAGVDAPDPALRALADSAQPRLRDAYVQVLQIYAGGLRPGAPPDADYVARRLQDATDRVLKKPGGKLLLGGIMVN